MCKRNIILKRDTKSSIKIPSEKGRFGTGTGWDGSTMAWAELNDVEVSSRVKSKTFSLRKDVFVGRDDVRGEWF